MSDFKIGDTLIDLLRCFHTGSKLTLMSKEQLEKLNECVTAEQVANSSGQRVTEPLEAALINEDASWAYVVDRGLPKMLPEAAIPLATCRL